MFKESLIKFLTSKPLYKEEEAQFINEIKKIIYFSMKNLPYEKLTRIYSKESINEEILSETIIKIYNKRSIILGKIERIDSLKSYIKFLVVNHLKDNLKKAFIETEEIQKEPKSEEKELKAVVKMDAGELMKLLKKELTKTEKEALCFDFLKINNPSKSRGSSSKAKSRAKKKIKEIVEENNFSKEIAEFALNNLFMSEICKNVVNRVKVDK